MWFSFFKNYLEESDFIIVEDSKLIVFPPTHKITQFHALSQWDYRDT